MKARPQCNGDGVFQCDECGEYLLEDGVMARVEEMIEHSDASAELEILRYAA